MNSLGRISHMTKKGHFVLKGCERLPAPTSFVVTKNSKRIGRIKDIFGPSANPYILVHPTSEAASAFSSLKEETLYELPRKRRKKRR